MTMMTNNIDRESFDSVNPKEIFLRVESKADAYLAQIDENLYINLIEDKSIFRNHPHYLALRRNYGGNEDTNEIRIALNMPLLKRYAKECGFDRNRLEKEVEVSIFHEIGHGIVDYFRDMYEFGDDDDIEDFFRQPKAASLMSACESDEESEVEDFGQWMAGLDGRQPVLDKLVIEWVDYWKIKESKSNK